MAKVTSKLAELREVTYRPPVILTAEPAATGRLLSPTEPRARVNRRPSATDRMCAPFPDSDVEA